MRRSHCTGQNSQLSVVIGSMNARRAAPVPVLNILQERGFVIGESKNRYSWGKVFLSDDGFLGGTARMGVFSHQICFYNLVFVLPNR